MNWALGMGHGALGIETILDFGFWILDWNPKDARGLANAALSQI
ncbi:hypothetical protein NIES22_42810 [Calothrix brevissima NIES-22]|nr:hypothetical protein NIES22_42810 [Calothrix brevissima NIES-22]